MTMSRRPSNSSALVIRRGDATPASQASASAGSPALTRNRLIADWTEHSAARKRSSTDTLRPGKRRSLGGGDGPPPGQGGAPAAARVLPLARPPRIYELVLPCAVRFT